LGWNTVTQMNLPVSGGYVNVTSSVYDTIRVLVPLRADAGSLMPFSMLTYAVISYLRSLARLEEPGLISRPGFEHPASTLLTRFPAALDIGHGHACGLANPYALVYVAA